LFIYIFDDGILTIGCVKKL